MSGQTNLGSFKASMFQLPEKNNLVISINVYELQLSES